jgi:hypothetical protein
VTSAPDIKPNHQRTPSAPHEGKCRPDLAIAGHSSRGFEWIDQIDCLTSCLCVWSLLRLLSVRSTFLPLTIVFIVYSHRYGAAPGSGGLAVCVCVCVCFVRFNCASPAPWSHRCLLLRAGMLYSVLHFQLIYVIQKTPITGHLLTTPPCFLYVTCTDLFLLLSYTRSHPSALCSCFFPRFLIHSDHTVFCFCSHYPFSTTSFSSLNTL